MSKLLPLRSLAALFSLQGASLFRVFLRIWRPITINLIHIIHLIMKNVYNFSSSAK